MQKEKSTKTTLKLKESENYLSLQELCKELSISEATAHNWLKRGKLLPSIINKKNILFSREYVRKLQELLKNQKNSLLKSRRNKNFASGNNIYNSYVSASSKNIFVVQEIMDYINMNAIQVNDDFINAFLGECALQLLMREKNSSTNCLKKFLKNELPLEEYDFLITDICKKRSTLKIIEQYEELFNLKFFYEPKEDVLGFLYLSLKNVNKRKASGSYYTPTKIVKKMCKELFAKTNDLENKTILDPCCGTGNFLLQLSETILYENVYGNDNDPLSVKIARINIALKYNFFDKDFLYTHITKKDYLNTNQKEKYDYIIGNPPWGYQFSDIEQQKLKKKYKSINKTTMESFDLFIEKSLKNVKDSGTVFFILPESILNVQAHKKIREIIIKSASIQYIEFLGNAFDKVQCPCILLELINTKKEFTTKGIKINNGKKIYKIKENRKVDSTNFNFFTTDEEYKILKKIENIPEKITLKNRAIFALGIVTGNNKEFLTSKKSKENEMILKGVDIYKYRYKNADNYIQFLPELFQQVASPKIYRAQEKLLYRFISNQLVFAYDNKQTLSLNSANILIPTIKNIDIKYILAILNSRISQFYYQKNFNSVKILRSHIEQIPIPSIKEEEQKQLIFIVDKLLELEEKKTIEKLYDELDMRIANLYNLTKEEYEKIKKEMQNNNLFLY